MARARKLAPDDPRKTERNPRGGGRPAGKKNKWTLLSDEQRKALADQNDGLTPLQFFLSLLRDMDTPMEHKLEAARIAAPYMHRKMPLAIEGGDPSKPIFSMNAAQLKGLSDLELSTLYAILAKLNA